MMIAAETLCADFGVTTVAADDVEKSCELQRGMRWHVRVLSPWAVKLDLAFEMPTNLGCPRSYQQCRT